MRLLMITLLAPLVGAATAHAQSLLFQDEFNGTSFNTGAWNVYSSANYLHRTQFGNQPTLGSDGDGTRFTRLRMDTYNAANPGTYFRGTEILSKSVFTVGNGMEFEARVRGTNIPRGSVWAFFTIGEKGVWPDGYTRDEIDFEIIGNRPSNELWLDIFNEWNPRYGYNDGVHASEMPVTVSGLNWRQWNVFKIRWLSSRTEWYVNNVLVRTSTTVRPDDPMSVRFNIWAARSDWTFAYDGSLNPTRNFSNNESYYFDVDYVRVRSLPAPPQQTPFGTAPVAIPGTVQAENYDRGGPGVAYLDATAANQGGAYRPTEGVDVGPSGDSGGGYDVGWTATGEWLEYTVNVAKAGTYNVEARVASNGAGGTFRLEFNGVNKTGNLTIPNTGGWQVYRTVTKTGVSLAAGTQVMRLVMNSVGASGAVGNFNSLRFTAAAVDTTPPAVTIHYPRPSLSYNYSVPDANGIASDAGSGVAQVRGRLSRARDGYYWSGTGWLAGVRDVAAQGTTSWKVFFPALPAGTYTFQAIARDAAGNTTYSAPVPFSVTAG